MFPGIRWGRVGWGVLLHITSWLLSVLWRNKETWVLWILASCLIVIGFLTQQENSRLSNLQNFHDVISQHPPMFADLRKNPNKSWKCAEANDNFHNSSPSSNEHKEQVGREKRNEKRSEIPRWLYLFPIFISNSSKLRYIRSEIFITIPSPFGARIKSLLMCWNEVSGEGRINKNY